MKPTVVDDEEDDLQAEEENKLINEVRVILFSYAAVLKERGFSRNTRYGTRLS
jgi:hypothetical protein